MKNYEVFTTDKSFRTTSLDYARKMAEKYSLKFGWASIEDGEFVLARYANGRLSKLGA